MNPDVTLAALRFSIDMACKSDSIEEFYYTMYQVVARFEELDSWLKRGGFPPTDWRR